MKISSNLKVIGISLGASSLSAGLTSFISVALAPAIVTLFMILNCGFACALLYIAHLQLEKPLNNHRRYWQDFQDGTVDQYEFDEEMSTEIGELFREISTYLKNANALANQLHSINAGLTSLVSHTYFTSTHYLQSSDLSLKR